MQINFEIPKSLMQKLSGENLEKKIDNLFQKAGNFMDNNIRENINKKVYQDKIGSSYVFSGKLQKSPKARKSKTQINLAVNTKSVGAGVNYATFVNFGTRKMRARNFMTPTFEDTKQYINKLLKETNVFDN